MLDDTCLSKLKKALCLAESQPTVLASGGPKAAKFFAFHIPGITCCYLQRFP